MGGILESNVSLGLIITALFLGVFGQFLRALMGFYKLIIDPCRPFSEFFVWRKFLVSLALGGVVGIIASLVYKIPLSGPDMLGIMAAGYAGTDFLEPFLNRKAPQ